MVPCPRIDHAITWGWCARDTTRDDQRLIEPIPLSDGVICPEQITSTTNSFVV
ncbi:hypothetical protein L3055_03815 [Corynebacterium sp. MC-02]|uniref:hypothetical protein n=1 Tax=Corynebacterium pseudokroppenstedtii TaxID=2804917 RepID=UPI001F454154|nr:hypothetical protein [Corynebacterium pseudokroppenstedtii]MCF8702683.1 hypothetical protein [Corynebacterium pseudokroppenstedtii]MDU6480295.1 hypothetical protein [Corynebacterium kroppenstedtii]